MKIYLIDSSSLSSLSSLLGITIFSLLCLFFSFLYIQILPNKFGKYSRSLFLNTESSTVAVQQNNESLFWVLFYSENLFFPMMLLILFRNYIYFSSNFLTLISRDMHWDVFYFLRHPLICQNSINNGLIMLSILYLLKYFGSISLFFD